MFQSVKVKFKYLDFKDYTFTIILIHNSLFPR